MNKAECLERIRNTTHCKRGHVITVDSVFIWDRKSKNSFGWECKTCALSRSKEKRTLNSKYYKVFSSVEQEKLCLLYKLAKNAPSKDVWMRFWLKVAIKKWRQCWEWQAAKSRGYGSYSNKTASRVVSLWMHGDFPVALDVDHIWCNNRLCVNPLHLIPTTRKANCVRPGSKSKSYANSLKTHCSRGHMYSGDNIIWQRQKKRKLREVTPLRRRCRACEIERGARRREEKQRLLLVTANA